MGFWERSGVKNIRKVEKHKLKAYHQWLNGWFEDTGDTWKIYVMTKNGLCTGEIDKPKRRIELNNK